MRVTRDIKTDLKRLAFFKQQSDKYYIHSDKEMNEKVKKREKKGRE